MTDKEKAEAYDKAIERAKKWHNTPNIDKTDNRIIEEIFPELKESNDEKMKNFIINELACLRATDEKGSDRYEEFTNAIAWLETDGKNSTDKIEPKFNVGDWVIFITSKSVYQVEKIENYEYILRHILGGSLCLAFFNEKLIREWTIQDANDGDTLVCDIDKCEIGGDVERLLNIVSTIFNFKKLINSRDYIHSYCHLYDKRFLGLQRTMYYNSFVHNISPATKEQRDTLTKAINDAGYEWNAKKKIIYEK